jgi:hypothetical protein
MSYNKIRSWPVKITNPYYTRNETADLPHLTYSWQNDQRGKN